MLAPSVRIQDLSDLRGYVHAELCDLNELDSSSFEMTERVLVRGGKPCGIFFCVHGPRSVQLTAIWETDRNTILFYGSGGQRRHKTQLVHAPELAPVAA